MTNNPGPRSAVVSGLLVLLFTVGIVFSWVAWQPTASARERASASPSSIAGSTTDKLSLLSAMGPLPSDHLFTTDGGTAAMEEKGEAEEDEQLLGQESFWMDRLTYPTGRFDPSWLRRATEEDTTVERSVPSGRY